MDHGAIGVNPNELLGAAHISILAVASVRLLGEVSGSFGVFGGAFRITGIVRENSVPKARVVRAYSRVTGLIVASAVSSSVDGTFVLSLAVAEPVYVVALDDETLAPDFNALIYDFVEPV